MKKILTLLLMVSVVAGMTLPAMAGTDASAVSTSNGGSITKNTDIDVTGSNYAAHSVAVTLNAAPQTNNLHDVLAASGSNTNGAVANLAASAKAKDATSGPAMSGSSGSGAATSGGAGASVDKVKANDDSSASANPEVTTGDANSQSSTGDAYSGDAKNVAKASDNSNSASANGNMLMTGNADNEVKQLNIIKQMVPIDINADQKLVQKVYLDDYSTQDASSNPETIAKAKSDVTKKSLNIGAGDDLNIEITPFV